MSLEDENQLLLERKSESQQKSKISYTRDELLSFSNLDICKKLPSGFDASILSEFDEASIIVNERQRGFGGLPFQSTKRSEYGSSPPNRLEGTGSYSQGSSGRWDARSSGSNNRDGEIQSNREAFMQDSGRRFGTQSRRFSQQPEHDGLLGSGAFPRASAYAGPAAPKVRATSHFQLNRTSEPYQPPRPYKALPFQRKDDKDSCNDETFGSSDYSSEDRAEEERRRRASFELMRKEQQKALQDKQKKIPDNHKENPDADIIALLANSADNKSIMGKSDKAADSSPSQNDPSKVSATKHTSLSRPLVPPGFSSTAVDQNLPVQTSSNSSALEASFAGTVDNLPLDVTNNDLEKSHQSAASLDNNSMLKDGSISALTLNVDGKLAIPPSGVVKLPPDAENVSSTTSGFQKVNKIWEEVIENDVPDNKKDKFEVTNSLMQDSSMSILEKLLGGSLEKTSGSSPTSSVNQGFKTDEETWIPAISESSKFASWFVEEENKHVEDFSSKDLLSLIVNNEKVSSSASAVSRDKAIEHVASSLPFEINDTTEKLDASPSTSLMVGIPEQYNQGDKLDSSPVVLTCEDLEQSILADIKDSSSNLQHAGQGPWTSTDGKLEQQKSDVDDHASQHLLSLLQKGTKKEKEMVSVTSSGLDIGIFDKLSIIDTDPSFNLDIVGKATSCYSETVSSSEKTLTLEALFGAAFMNELQSAQAPVSVQRVADGGINTTTVPTSLRSPHPNSDATFFSSSAGDYSPNKPVHERDMASLNHIQDANLRYIPGPAEEHGNSLVEDSKLGAADFEDRALEIHLPDEDSLIIASDALDSVTSDPLPFIDASKSELLSEKNVECLNSKLLDAIPRDAEHARPSSLDGLPPFRSPHDLVGSDNFYHHLQGRASSQLPHIVNHSRPLHPGLDHLTNRNQQMKLIGSEGIHHDPHRNFLENIVPHNTSNHASGPRIEPAAYHLMLQQMPIAGNFPQQLPFPGFPRGVPLSHHINHMQGYIPDMNNVHNVSLHQQQPNYGSFGMGMPGSLVGGGGGNHPEAFQRLIEMELRAKAKQVHPSAAGHIPGIYGPEFDMSFRYR